MKVVVRTAFHVIKEADLSRLTRRGLENDGCQFAVFTKENQADPEWQCDGIVEALEWIEEVEQKLRQVSCLDKYGAEVHDWAKRVGVPEIRPWKPRTH
jgi:hypothetical protein